LAGDRDHVKDVERVIAVEGSDGQLLDLIEAVFVTLAELRTGDTFQWFGLEEEEAFRERVNEILDDHDLAYQVVGDKVVPRDSMAMHADVVAPVLSLLHGDHRLEKVEKAFQDALSELKPSGNPADAITDAGTALQEMLTVLGTRGNALGPLLADARKRGLLARHDAKLVDWVSAVRSEQGDAHAVTDADRDDAWLAVHVVGRADLAAGEAALAGHGHARPFRRRDQHPGR
jgi:hypothetical protein